MIKSPTQRCTDGRWQVWGLGSELSSRACYSAQEDSPPAAEDPHGGDSGGVSILRQNVPLTSPLFSFLPTSIIAQSGAVRRPLPWEAMCWFFSTVGNL